MRKPAFVSYCATITIVAILFITIPIVLGLLGDLSTRDSYLRSVVCFFILTIISSRVLLGKKYVRYYLAAFVVLTLLALTHFLILVEPHYFRGFGDAPLPFHSEYQNVFSNVGELIENRKIYGLFYYDDATWSVTHPTIWRIISWPMTFLGHKWLNYSPLNVFASLLASMHVVLLYKNYTLKRDNNDGGFISDRVIMFTTAYFPLWWFSDQVWRDPMGVALIAIGLAFISLSKSVFIKTISSAIFIYFSYLQRIVYVVIAGTTIILKGVRIKKNAIRFFLIPLFAILWVYLIFYYGEHELEGYAGQMVNVMSFIALPLKIVFGMIGPFPWAQFLNTFSSEYSASFSFQLQDYFLGTFQLGYLFAVVANFKRISFRDLDYMTIMGFGIMFAGFMTTMMHIDYIAEGTFFTIPWLFRQIGSKFWKYFGIAFLTLVLLNVFVMSFGISGISSMWR